MYKEQLLNNMAPDTLSKVSRGTGDLIGLASLAVVPELDLPTFGMSLGAKGVMGKLMPWVLGKLEGAVSPALTKMAGGALESAVVGAPMSYSQYQNQKDIGLNPSPLTILTTDGLFAGLGGFIGLGADWKAPLMNADDHVTTRSTAINQVANGKPAYVEPLIKNGVYQMSKDMEPFLDRFEEKLDINESDGAKLDNKIKGEQTKLGKMLKEKNLDKSVQELKTGKEFINDLEKIREKPVDLRTESDIALLKRFESPSLREKEPSTLTKAYDLSSKPAGMRTEAENDFFNEFVSNKEKSRTQQEINQLNFDKNDLEKKRDELPEGNERTKLNFRISDIDKEIDKNKTRLDDLKKIDDLKKDNPKILNKIRSIRRLNDKREGLRNASDNMRLYQHVLDQYSTPVAESDVRSTANWIKDWRSDFVYSPEEHSDLTSEIEGIPDNVALDLTPEMDQINAMRERGELSEEAQEYIDGFEEEDNMIKRFFDSLKAWAQCVIGGNP
jgi:hypothetical protein